MVPWFKGLSQRAQLSIFGAGIALVVLVVVGVVALTSGSSGKSAAETPASEAEVNELIKETEEAEGEAAEEATDPSIPRNLEKMIVAHPRNEVATEEQLKQQILTNGESSDPTHKQEASCSYTSSYSHYTHYICEGYSLGGQNSAIAQMEVTVNTDTGEVLVEEG